MKSLVRAVQPVWLKAKLCPLIVLLFVQPGCCSHESNDATPIPSPSTGRGCCIAVKE